MKPLRAVTIASWLAAASLDCMSTSTPSSPAPLDVEPQPATLEDSDTIPCAPRLVLQSVCQRCHRRPPIRGAPFPLVTRSDIVRRTSDGEIRELMIEQLTARRMPLSPETIDEASRATLLAWLEDGAPADPAHDCVVVDAGDAGQKREAAVPDAAPDATEEDAAPVDASGD